MTPQSSLTFDLASEDATRALAQRLASLAKPGLCVLLHGPVGAGKTFLARAAIQHLMKRANPDAAVEDVPSPTFTLVQSYTVAGLEIWHADLYRLTNTDELFELGLEQAFEQAFCLIEWPDRLGSFTPKGALTLSLAPDQTNDTLRHATLTGPADVLARLARVTA